MRRWSHLTVLKLETILKLTVQHETTSSSCYVNVSKARFDHQLGSQLRVVEQSYGWFRGSSWREAGGSPCTGAKHGNFQNGWGRDAGGKLLVIGRLDHELSLAWWGSVDIFRCFVNCQVTWHLRVANGCKWLVLHCGSFKTCPIKRTRYLGFRGDSDHSWVRTGRWWKCSHTSLHCCCEVCFCFWFSALVTLVHEFWSRKHTRVYQYTYNRHCGPTLSGLNRSWLTVPRTQAWGPQRFIRFWDWKLSRLSFGKVRMRMIFFQWSFSLILSRVYLFTNEWWRKNTWNGSSKKHIVHGMLRLYQPVTKLDLDQVHQTDSTSHG